MAEQGVMGMMGLCQQRIVCDTLTMTATTLPETDERPFTPGTTGWSADDLLDPSIERLWERGAYEIVEGVLTIVPPGKFDASSSLFKLCMLVSRFMENKGLKGRFAPETDYIVSRKRVARADAVLIREADFPRHRRTSESSPRTRRKGGIGRLTSPSTLVIELLSPGHEDHDRTLKFRWYEAAGVPHYWLLDEPNRKLECYRRKGSKFVLDASGERDQIVRPALFRGLQTPLEELWL